MSKPSLGRRLRSLAFTFASLAPMGAPAARAAETNAPARDIEVVVDGRYQPSQIGIKKGERVRLTFVRKDFSGCTRELVIPVMNLRRELPTNKPVVIELPSLDVGSYEFRCGMNMVRGVITVSAG